MLGTSAAYFYSILSIIVGMVDPDFVVTLFFETSTLLITFVLLGRLLKEIAKRKTSQAISKLLSLQPTTAILLIPNEKGELEEKSIDLKLIQKKDVLKVVPGEKIPADGKVVYGSTFVDESMITGESLPASKKIGDNVIAGSMDNVNSSLN